MILNEDDSTRRLRNSSFVKNKILFLVSVNIWGSKPEPKIERTASQTAPTAQQKTIQSTVIIPEDPCNYFTFRDGVVDNAVKECREEFLDEDCDGPLLAYFLLTQ